MWLNSCCCPTKEELGVMAGSGSEEACSDSPASSKEERKMAKRQVGLRLNCLRLNSFWIIFVQKECEFL